MARPRRTSGSRGRPIVVSFIRSFLVIAATAATPTLSPPRSTAGEVRREPWTFCKFLFVFGDTNKQAVFIVNYPEEAPIHVSHCVPKSHPILSITSKLLPWSQYLLCINGLNVSPDACSECELPTPTEAAYQGCQSAPAAPPPAASTSLASSAAQTAPTSRRSRRLQAPSPGNIIIMAIADRTGEVQSRSGLNIFRYWI